MRTLRKKKNRIRKTHKNTYHPNSCGHSHTDYWRRNILLGIGKSQRCNCWTLCTSNTCRGETNEMQGTKKTRKKGGGGGKRKKGGEKKRKFIDLHTHPALALIGAPWLPCVAPKQVASSLQFWHFIPEQEGRSSWYCLSEHGLQFNSSCPDEAFWNVIVSLPSAQLLLSLSLLPLLLLL